MRLKFWQRSTPKVVEWKPSYQGWLNISRTTLAARDHRGFHSPDTAEAMAAVAMKAQNTGASKDEIISAVEAEYSRHFFYSTPHEHPCDEWNWRDVMRAAA